MPPSNKSTTTAVDGPKHTHILVVPTRGAAFNRCGIRFESKSPRLIALELVRDGDLDRLENEPMLAVKRLTAREAEAYQARAGVITTADLPAELAKLEAKVADQERTIAKLVDENGQLARDLALTRGKVLNAD